MTEDLGSHELMIPRKIHRVWLGSDMPAEYQEFERQWASLHPGWVVKTWGEADLDWLANRAAFDDAPSLSAKADIARYEIVESEGGVYVDCDFQPLRNIEELLIGAGLVVGEERPGIYANGFFAATAHHSMLQYAIEQLPSSHFDQPDAPPPKRTGPEFWTRCIERFAHSSGDFPRVLTREQLYPYSFDQPHLRDATFPEAWAVHHWAMSWAQALPVQGYRRELRTWLKKSAARAKSVFVSFSDRFDRLPPVRLRARNPIAVYVGNNRLLVETLQRFQVLAFADDLCETPSLVSHGCHDRPFARFLEREIRRGDVVVDVGANIGLVTLHCARLVGAGGRVFAFEPNPDACAMLNDSLYISRTTGVSADVQVHGVAVGDSSGVATLHVPRQHRGRASLNSSNADGDDILLFEVPMVRLDDVLAGVPEINLVKVDAEGSELAVLRGMAGLIRSGRVRMLDLELDDDLAGPQWDELAELLREFAAFARSTFILAPDGSRRPMSVGAALHQTRLVHWVLEF